MSLASRPSTTVTLPMGGPNSGWRWLGILVRLLSRFALVWLVVFVASSRTRLLFMASSTSWRETELGSVALARSASRAKRTPNQLLLMLATPIRLINYRGQLATYLSFRRASSVAIFASVVIRLNLLVLASLLILVSFSSRYYLFRASSCQRMMANVFAVSQNSVPRKRTRAIASSSGNTANSRLVCATLTRVCLLRRYRTSQACHCQPVPCRPILPTYLATDNHK